VAAYEIYTHREAISGTTGRIVSGTGTADDYYNATSLLGGFLGGGRTSGRGMRDGARYGPATRRFLEGELRNFADLLADEGGSIGPGSRAPGAAGIERLARRFNLRASSPTTRVLLENLEMTVDEYIAQYRQGRVRGMLSTAVRAGTVREALEAGDSTVRKMLTDGRFAR